MNEQDRLRILHAHERAEWQKERKDLVQALFNVREENTQAQALLKTWVAWASTPSRQSDDHLLQVYEQTSAFLARPKAEGES